jgi:hypothetical protein
VNLRQLFHFPLIPAFLGVVLLVGSATPASADPVSTDAVPAAEVTPIDGDSVATEPPLRHPARRRGDPPSDRADPPVDVLCRAAVALAFAEPERARGFIARARAAGWLPEVRFRVFRRFARTEGLTLDDTVTGAPVDVSAVDDVRYEWRATWDLSRMVFNPDELQAHAEAIRMSDVRRDIQSLVIHLYFERRRLLLESTTTDARNPEGGGSPRRRLRVLEFEAQLDALSGGAFSAGERAQAAGAAP